MNEPIQEEASGTAYQIPEGILLVYSQGKNLNDGRKTAVNSKAIAPSILKNFEVELPDYMMRDTIDSIAN